MSRKVNWFRVPTPITPMILMEGLWDDAGLFRIPDRLQPAVDPDLIGADVRFRFHYPKEAEKQAKTEAEGFAQLLRAAGAINVRLDPKPEPEIRARIPELTTAATLEEKGALYRKSLDQDVKPDEQKILDSYLQEIQDELAAEGVTIAVRNRAVPYLKRISGKGLKCFDQFDVNVEQLEGPLTAIVAPNESGKTILASLMGPGLMYRNTPNRGALQDLSRSKDTQLTGVFEMNSKEYTLSHMINGLVKVKTGSSSLACDGKPVIQKATRTEYDDWAKTNLLPWDQYLALLFHSGTEDDGGHKTSIIDMKDGDRTALMLRVLGIEFYGAIAERARRNATAVSSELDKVTARISELGDEDFDHLNSVVADATNALETERGNLAAAEQELNQQRERAAAIEKKRTERNALERQQSDLFADKTRVEQRLADIDERLENNRGLIAKEAEIRAAAARAAQLNKLEEQIALHAQSSESLKTERAALVALETRIATNASLIADADVIRKAVAETVQLQESLKAKEADSARQAQRKIQLEADFREVQARYHGNAQKAAELQRAINAADLILGEGGYLKAAAVEAAKLVKKLEAEIASEEIKQGHYWVEVEAQRKIVSTVKDNRIQNFEAPIKRIAQKAVADPAAIARKALEDDGSILVKAKEAPGRLTEAEKNWKDVGANLKDLRETLAIQQRTANKLPEMETAERTRLEAQAAEQTVWAARATILQETNGIAAQQEALASEVAQTQSDIRWLNEQIEGLTPQAARAEMLATAEAVSVELGQQKTRVTAEIERLGREVLRIDAVLGLSEDPDNQDAVIERLRAEKIIVDARATLEEKLNETTTRIEELTAQRADVQGELDIVVGKVGGIVLSDVEEPIQLQPYEDEVERTRNAIAQCDSTLTIAEKTLSDARKRATRLADLYDEASRHRVSLDRWNRLAREFGPDGLPKEEVANAGPELTRLTNELLLAGGDTRHTVDIRTEKEHSREKRMIPCFEILVTDHEEGETKEARRLSGAGAVLVGKPLTMAMNILGCERAGITRCTIWEDELTGPADKNNSVKIIGELRYFAQRLNARVFFISQDPDIQAMADSRITIDKGVVTAI